MVLFIQGIKRLFKGYKLKMLNRIQAILAVAALLLGIAHLAFGVIVYKSFSLELLWFLGTGIAMITTALANLNSGSTVWILRVQNALMLGFILALVILAPQPQIWLGLILFTGLLFVSFVKSED